MADFEARRSPVSRGRKKGRVGGGLQKPPASSHVANPLGSVLLAEDVGDPLSRFLPVLEQEECWQ